MKNLNNTLTTILFNEKGFIRPYFNYRSNVNDLIKWGKENLKSEWDLEWDTEEELESIINAMLGQISTKEELSLFDEMMLEFGCVQTHLICENRDNEIKDISVFFMEDRGDDYSNIRTLTTLNKGSEVYKLLKKIYKDEDTILDLELHKKVVRNVSNEVVSYFMEQLVNDDDELPIREKLSYNKVIIVHAATLLNMEEDDDKKNILERFVDSMVTTKDSLEEIIIDEKVNDLLD